MSTHYDEIRKLYKTKTEAFHNDWGYLNAFTQWFCDDFVKFLGCPKNYKSLNGEKLLDYIMPRKVIYRKDGSVSYEVPEDGTGMITFVNGSWEFAVVVVLEPVPNSFPKSGVVFQMSMKRNGEYFDTLITDYDDTVIKIDIRDRSKWSSAYEHITRLLKNYVSAPYYGRSEERQSIGFGIPVELIDEQIQR